MDRETFEKISGGSLRVRSATGNCVIWCHYEFNGKSGEGVLVNDVPVDVDTPFRLRCLLHGLGIACDWDQPVTFERLCKLPGAATWGAMPNRHVSFGVTPEVEGLLVEFSQTISGDWKASIGAGYDQPITTMRQVHLLLEAAGVK